MSARSGPRPSRFVLDLLLTTATSLLTIVALVILTRLTAERLGPDGFGAFMLARRLVATADPVTTFAMGVAMTRAVSLAHTDGERLRLLRAGTVLAAVPALLAFALSALAPERLAEVLYRDQAFGSLVVATGAMILGYSFFTILYSWYRATNRMTLANAWQLWGIAVGPVLVAWLVAAPGQEAAIVWGMGVLLLVAAVPVMAASCVRSQDGLGFWPAVSEWRQLVRYAAPRIPAGFAFAALLAAGPLLASRFGTLRDVGFIAVGIALLRVVEGGTEAFGRVALPKVTQMFAAGGSEVLRDPVADVAAVVVHLGLFASGQLWIWSPQIVSVWLGPQYADAVPIVRWVVVSVLPYLIFVTLRSVLDAIEERAVNTVNLMAALVVATGVSLALALSGRAGVGAAIGTTVGLSLLGLLTLRAVQHRCQFSLATVKVWPVLWINAVLIAAAATAATVVGGMTPTLQLVFIALAEVVLLSIYVAGLWWLQVRWLGELRRRVSWGGW